MKPIIFFSLIFLAVALGAVIAPKEKRVCADFSSQAEAQEAFKKDYIKYRGLDGNLNYIACEYYQYKK